MTTKNYYKILQVDAEAESEVIKAAYARLARKYHPDVNTAPNATLRMQEINEAYEVLSDPAKRTQYDKQRLDAERTQRQPDTGKQTTYTAPPQPTSTHTVSTARTEQRHEETDQERKRRFEEAERYRAEQRQREQAETARYVKEERRRRNRQQWRLFLLLACGSVVLAVAWVHSSQYQANTVNGLVSGGLTSNTSNGPAYGYTYFDAVLQNNAWKDKWAYFKVKLHFASGETCEAINNVFAPYPPVLVPATSTVKQQVSFWCSVADTNAPDVAVSLEDCQLVIGDDGTISYDFDQSEKRTVPCSNSR